jgi:hypothetical protein
VAKDTAQFANNEDTLLSVGPFMGLDSTTDPYFVAPNNCVSQQNVSINRAYASYCTAQGRIANYTGGLVPNSPILALGITSVLRGNTGTSYTPGIFIFSGIGASTATGTAYYAGFNQPPVAVSGWGTSTTAQTPLTNLYDSNWVFAGSFVFLDCPIVQPKYLTPFVADDPNFGVVAYNWGIAAPITAPIGTALAVPFAMDSPATYYYAVTFVNTRLSPNSESSSSPFSAAVFIPGIFGGSVQLSAIPVSPDPQVNQRDIYRFGGTIGGTPLLIGVITDNTTTTFLDNLNDRNVTGQQLILRQDPAPTNGWQSIAYHKGRMWGLGSLQTTTVGKSDLWFSNYLQPTSFNSVTQVLDCGSDLNDKPIALASLDSVLIALKQQSIWITYGDTQNDFITRKVFSATCVSKGSVAVGYGKLFWLGSDGVYMFDGSSVPTNISDGSVAQGSIRDTVDTLLAQPNNNIGAPNVGVRGFIVDRTYYMGIYSVQNNVNPITYAYDLVIGAWTVLPYSASAVGVCRNTYNNPTAVVGGPLTLSSDLGTPGQIDWYFAAETDLANPIVSSWLTQISDSGATALTKQYRFIEVIAPTQTETLNVTFTVNPGLNSTILPTFSTAYNIDLSIGTSRHRISLPPTAVGYECQLLLGMSTSSKTIINKVSVLGYIKRQSSPPPLNS